MYDNRRWPRALRVEDRAAPGFSSNHSPGPTAACAYSLVREAGEATPHGASVNARGDTAIEIDPSSFPGLLFIASLGKECADNVL